MRTGDLCCHTVQASEEEPRYIIRDDSTSKEAVYKSDNILEIETNYSLSKGVLGRDRQTSLCRCCSASQRAAFSLTFIFLILGSCLVSG